MARTKQTARKSNPTSGLATHQGETESSSSEEPARESTISETHGERESGEQIEQPRTARKRKRGDRTASSSLSSADHTRKSRKVAVEYSTDETDEEKIPDMEEGMGFPRQKKTVKLTLPATPSRSTWLEALWNGSLTTGCGQGYELLWSVESGPMQ